MILILINNIAPHKLQRAICFQGTFNLTLTGADKCRGPKHKDCATMQVEISDHNILYYDVNVTQNVILTKVSIFFYFKTEAH